VFLLRRVSANRGDRETATFLLVISIRESCDPKHKQLQLLMVCDAVSVCVTVHAVPTCMHMNNTLCFDFILRELVD
jgi:hypothetical protein